MLRVQSVLHGRGMQVLCEGVRDPDTDCNTVPDPGAAQQLLHPGHTSIMMTASAIVRRVVPPMNAPAPISANTPGSMKAQGLGGRKMPSGLPAGTARGVGASEEGHHSGAQVDRRCRPARGVVRRHVAQLGEGHPVCVRAHELLSAAMMSMVTRPISRPTRQPMTSTAGSSNHWLGTSQVRPGARRPNRPGARQETS